MELGIIGLPKSGKTTIFNALTRGQATEDSTKPNLRVAVVLDPRLQRLAEVTKPQRVVPAEVHYTDLPGAPEGPGKTKGIGGTLLNALQQTDALLLVARAFQDPTVPHPEGTVDPYRDAAAMQLELAFSDLAILERRTQRLQKELKGARATERELAHRESALIARLKGTLEGEVPVREQQLSPEEWHSISDYQFLTAKPLLILFNIGEDVLTGMSTLESELASRFQRPGTAAAALCGKLEMELAQMDQADEQEFRISLGAGESGTARVSSLAYNLLGQISFFTTASNEVKAWTVSKDTPAAAAAGRIHSDMERGFIRAEVVPYEELVRCGSVTEARRQGLLRTEGRAYPVQDGDVITFLFNV